MAYEASQNGFRGLIAYEDIHTVTTNPNYMEIEFKAVHGGLQAKDWLHSFLNYIRYSPNPFAAYKMGKVRFENPNGNHVEHSLHEIRTNKKARDLAMITADQYGNGRVEFIVYNGESIRDADALLVFNSGNGKGIEKDEQIFLLMKMIADESQEKPTKSDRQRVWWQVKPFIPRESLNKIVTKLFREFG